MSESLLDQQRALTDYWVRIGHLTEGEWGDFYRRVRSALLRCSAAELSGLPDSKESYIDEFFAEKIFYRAHRSSSAGIQSLSGGALCTFFRNYLRDRLDTYKRFSDDDPMELDDQHGDAERSVLDEFLASTGEAELARSATLFLKSLPDWGMLMLSKHFCADDDEAVPMSSLCRDISSYHYKAQKLGVTIGKNSSNLLGYEHTLIGKWISSLKVAIKPENYDIIHFLLGALCLEAAVLAQGAMQ